MRGFVKVAKTLVSVVGSQGVRKDVFRVVCEVDVSGLGHSICGKVAKLGWKYFFAGITGIRVARAVGLKHA